MLRLTPVVKNLLIINIAVFLIINIFKGFPVVDLLGLHPVNPAGLSNYPPEAVRAYLAEHWYLKFQPYQLFTYMFAQEGFTHILFNMMGLIFAGPILESTWGSMRFLAFYIICGIGAGVFNLLIDAFLAGHGAFASYHGFGSMIGASGAIYGIMTAFGIMFPNMEIRLLFFPVPIKAKYIVLGSAGLVFYSVYHSIYNPSPGDNVAHLAHLGGIVAAVLLLQFWKGLKY